MELFEALREEVLEGVGSPLHKAEGSVDDIFGS